MRTEREVLDARSFLVRQLIRMDITEDQRTLLQGMSVALQWVCGEGGRALQDLLEGRQIAVREVVR